MIDIYMRQVKDIAFRPLAVRWQRVSPFWFTLIGLIIGLVGVGLLLVQAYWLALAAWFLNRIFDALDGSVARVADLQSDLGGYLDILADFVIYSLVPVGLVWGRPLPLGYLALALLLSSFYVNAASWMYLAAILEKRAAGAANQGEQTSVTMPDGLVGGTVTIILFSAFIIFPAWYPQLFFFMAAGVVITILQRLVWAVKHLS